MSIDASIIRTYLSEPLPFAEQLGIIDGRRSYKRLSNGILVRCFAHGDRTPSLSITRTSTGLRFRCFGCDLAGDVFNAIAARHNLDVHQDFRQVVEIAAQMAGISEDGTYSKPPPPPLPPEEPKLDDDTFNTIVEVLENECQLRKDKEVCTYLALRGVLEEARNEALALPGDYKGVRRVRDAIVSTVGKEAWQLSGLAWKDGGFAWPEWRLMVPYREQGECAQAYTLQRRLIRPAVDDESKYRFPWRREARWPYGVDRVEDLWPESEVCFVEGLIDVWAMRAMCRRERRSCWVLGIPGVENWKAPWAKFVDARVAVLALDNDDAGETASDRIAPQLYAAGAIKVRREVAEVGTKDWAEATMMEAS